MVVFRGSAVGWSLMLGQLGFGDFGGGCAWGGFPCRWMGCGWFGAVCFMCGKSEKIIFRCLGALRGRGSIGH